MPETESTRAAEIEALAQSLQAHDPEPYFPGNWEDAAYYRAYAEAILASGLRVIPPASTTTEAQR